MRSFQSRKKLKNYKVENQDGIDDSRNTCQIKKNREALEVDTTIRYTKHNLSKDAKQQLRDALRDLGYVKSIR